MESLTGGGGGGILFGGSGVSRSILSAVLITQFAHVFWAPLCKSGRGKRSDEIGSKRRRMGREVRSDPSPIMQWVNVIGKRKTEEEEKKKSRSRSRSWRDTETELCPLGSN